MKDKETRTYVVPLRREWLKVPRWRRTKRAVSSLRSFLLKHTKADEVKLSTWLNDTVWARGGKNPPGKVSVKVTMEGKTAKAELAEVVKRVERKKKEVAEAKKKLKERKAKEEEEAKAELKARSEEKPAEAEAEKEEQKKRAKVSKSQEMAMKK